VVWPEVAELSLCGALGCGGSLVAAAVAHLRDASHPRPCPKTSQPRNVKSRSASSSSSCSSSRSSRRRRSSRGTCAQDDEDADDEGAEAGAQDEDESDVEADVEANVEGEAEGEAEPGAGVAWGRYRAAVLQATDAAVPFYEKLGFVRVGAVSRWHDRLDMPEVGGGAGGARLREGERERARACEQS
jgi:hypothetical protein